MATKAIQEAIPDAIRREIAQKLRNGAKEAEKGWPSAPTSEDVLTGDMGRSLRTEWGDLIEDSGYFWRWRIKYRKFGAGNQHSSEEKALGADGIFQVEVKRFKIGVQPSSSQTVSLENVEEEYEFKKGMLFQSKRHDASDGDKLLEEVGKIERLTPGDGAYVEYGPQIYRAALAKKLLEANGSVANVSNDEFFRLGEFLADRFMECLVGVEGMYVDLDSNPQVLYFPEDNADVRKLGIRLSHAISVQVKAFKMVRFTKD